jgi:hypothetical protein
MRPKEDADSKQEEKFASGLATTTRTTKNINRPSGSNEVFLHQKYDIPILSMEDMMPYPFLMYPWPLVDCLD